MYCHNCGAQVPDGAKFCDNCGAALRAPEPAVKPEPVKTPEPTVKPEPEPATPAEPVSFAETAPAGGAPAGTGGIFKCGDGKYRWIYEMSLFRNPTIFLLLYKIFFFICLGILAASTIFNAVNDDLDADTFLGSLKVFFIALGVMTALLVVAYLIYAAAMGGKYIVMFEMDENGINHKQLPKEAKKAKILAGLTMLAGAASGSLTTTGAGIAASRTEMYSSFESVKKIKAYPRRHLIKVNGTLSHNQVYCESEDFDFVKNYITSRCPKAK